ncbi:TonB-dependent siderophore receptor [Phenylobacterium sp.]|uniref:TonB-dependent receptor n=1 Tax=Phenylobacterium sp. TaxID=1871053 RepID=UPI00301BCA73
MTIILMGVTDVDKRTKSAETGWKAVAGPTGTAFVALVGALASSSPAIAEAFDDSQGTPVSAVEVLGATDAESPKRTAKLLDTPQTVSVIPQQIIEERGARNLTEVLRNTPGISFNAGENGFSTSTNNFSMRGFDASGSVFIDGSRDSGSYARDVFNVERVEVVKGPAADNGRGGPGGYVNIVTKSPGSENAVSGAVSIGFDQYDSKTRKRGLVDINHVLADNLAVRLNAVLEDSGVPGRELARKKTWGIAPSVAATLSPNLRAILAYEHVSQDDRPEWGVPGASIKGTAAYNPLTAGAPRDAFYGLRSDFDDTRSDAVLLRFEGQFAEGLRITNQTRFSEVDRDARFTVPTGFTAATTLVPTQTQFYRRKNETLTNFTNLTVRFDSGSLSHSIAAGVEFTREKSDSDRLGTVNPPAASLRDPNPDRAAGAVLAPTERAQVKVDTVAAYVYDTIEIGEQWQITGGIRLESYDAEIQSRTAAGAPVGALANFKLSDTNWGGKIGLVYKPAPNASLYASVGTAAQPPGSYLSNPDISRTGENAFPGFVAGAKTVRSDNYEVGLKWDLFEGRLSTTAAVFHTVKRNAPITGRDVGETADSLKGYGKQVVQGVEIGVSGRITEAWEVYGGLAWIDSERKHSAYLDEVRRRANPADYGAFLRASGDKLAFTPDVTANLWTTYRFPFGLTLGGGVQHVGSSFLGRPDDANRIIPNGMFGKLPSYTLLHGYASYEVNETIDLRLNIDNLTNEKHAVSTNWNGSRATLGTPRAFLMTAAFRF